MVRAGEINRRIVIRRPEQVKTGKGGFTTSWTTIARPWAKVEGLHGTETVVANALQGIASYRITIRWCDPTKIKETDQITLPNGVIVNVRSSNDPDGKRERLLILADTSSVMRETV